MLVDLDFSGAPFMFASDAIHGVKKVRLHQDGPETGWFFTVEAEDGTDEELLWCGFYRHQLGVYSARAEDAFFRRQYSRVISGIDDFARKVMGISAENIARWIVHEGPSMMPFYGIADDIQQILSHEGYQWLLECEYPAVLIANKRKKKDHPGFRWHKNGPYIGRHEMQAEHFGDEPVVEQIWTYHFYILLGEA